jgi:hypothetical protein
MLDDPVTAAVLEEAAGGCVKTLAAASKGAARADLDFTTLSDMAKTQMRMNNPTSSHQMLSHSLFLQALAHGRQHLLPPAAHMATASVRMAVPSRI